MKWLIQSFQLQLSVLGAYVYTRDEDTDFRLVNLLIIGNILFVLLHPDSAGFGVLGILLTWKFYKTKKLTKF